MRVKGKRRQEGLGNATPRALKKECLGVRDLDEGTP